MRRLVAALLSALTLIIVLPSRAQAANIGIAWDAPTDAAVAGYVVEYGTAAAPFTFAMNVGTQTMWTFTGAVEGTTYIFRVRAYNAEGILSDPSDQVSWLVPALTTTPPPTTTTAPPPTTTTTTSSCVTPDPFASMGGGTCYSGGWLPPGMPVPGTTTATTTTPAPAPPPVPVVSSPSTCGTPDPFAGMGGGTCYNGGWLPPGMPSPGGGRAPSPAPNPAPAPSPAPAPVTYSTATCRTPDPFAGMGGGTCYNGGWLPPGMPVPGGAVASPSPTPAPAPTPSSPTGCATPDPFASIQSMVGYCRDGGWVPIPGQNGTVHLANDGVWVITGEDGVTYSPAEALDPSFQQDGLRVFFAGVPEVGDNGDALFQILKITLR